MPRARRRSRTCACCTTTTSPVTAGWQRPRYNNSSLTHPDLTLARVAEAGYERIDEDLNKVRLLLAVFSHCAECALLGLDCSLLRAPVASAATWRFGAATACSRSLSSRSSPTGAGKCLSAGQCQCAILTVWMRVAAAAISTPAGEGFQRVDPARDLTRDAGPERLFICIRRAPIPTADGKKEVRCLSCSLCLCLAHACVFSCFRGGQPLKVGDYLDCMDTVGKWCVAKIVNIKDNGEPGSAAILLFLIAPPQRLSRCLRTGKTYDLHFEGWSDKYDETVSATDKRLAP